MGKKKLSSKVTILLRWRLNVKPVKLKLHGPSLAWAHPRLWEGLNSVFRWWYVFVIFAKIRCFNHSGLRPLVPSSPPHFSSHWVELEVYKQHRRYNDVQNMCKISFSHQKCKLVTGWFSSNWFLALSYQNNI